MPPREDWATKAARYIDAMYPAMQAKAQDTEIGPQLHRPSIKRIAAIIATFAEPMTALLRDSRQCHQIYCHRAVLSLTLNGVVLYETGDEDGPCICGADAWNARVETVLRGPDATT